MCKSLNEIYNKNQLFYWHNACGEINMPGDGDGYFHHDLEELPLKCRQFYNQFFSEDNDCYCYVVNCEGKTGLLLVALYDEPYCCSEVCGFRTMPATNRVADIMALEYLTLKNRVNQMETLEVFSGCTILLGEYTDPVGHELALFIPSEKVEQFTEIKAAFLQHCWNAEDEERLKTIVRIMYANQ